MGYIVRNIIRTPRRSVSVIIGIVLIVFICGFGLNVRRHNAALLDEIKERTTVTVRATQKRLESERGKYIDNQHPILISDVRVAGERQEVSEYNFTFQSQDVFHMYEINLDADKLLSGRDSYEFFGAKYLDTVYVIGVRDISFIVDDVETPFAPDSDAAEAVISENIAEIHGLGVGDSIELGNVYPPLRIVSVCKKKNTIYVPIKLLESVGKVDQSYDTISVSCFDVTFRLRDPDDAQGFIRNVQRDGLLDDDWFYLEADDADYKVETARMKMLGIIINVLVVGVLTAGGIILAGIVVFHIRNKRYDMRVLRLLGIGSGRITLLNLGEMTLFAVSGTLIGIILAAFVCTALGYGFVLSVPVLLLSAAIMVLCVVTGYISSVVTLRHGMGE